MSSRTFSGILAFAATVMAVEWTCGLVWSPVNPDAGFFLPVARDILRGAVLYDEIPCRYPPFGIYAFCALGSGGVNHVGAAKALVAAVHGVNLALLYVLLRRMDFEHSVCGFGLAMASVWLLANDGAAIVLEPFGTTVLLASLLASTLPASTWSALSVGVAMACAVLIKAQHWVYVPAVFVLFGVENWTTASGNRFHLKNAAIAFGVLVAVVAATPILLGVPWSATVGRVFAFGATSDYPIGGLKGMILALSAGPGTGRIVGFWVALGVVLCWRNRCLGHLAVFLGLVLSILPLAIRDYGHYVQLSTVWVVIITLLAARDFGSDAKDTAASQRLWVAVVSAVMIPVWIGTVPVRYREWADRPRAWQYESSADIRRAVTDAEPTLVIDAPWLYMTADLAAPNHDYRFLVSPEAAADRRDAAKSAVWVRNHEVIPQGMVGERAADVQKWLENGGLRKHGVPELTDDIWIFRRDPSGMD